MVEGITITRIRILFRVVLFINRIIRAQATTTITIGGGRTKVATTTITDGITIAIHLLRGVIGRLPTRRLRTTPHRYQTTTTETTIPRPRMIHSQDHPKKIQPNSIKNTKPNFNHLPGRITNSDRVLLRVRATSSRIMMHATRRTTLRPLLPIVLQQCLLPSKTLLLSRKVAPWTLCAKSLQS